MLILTRINNEGELRTFGVKVENVCEINEIIQDGEPRVWLKHYDSKESCVRSSLLLMSAKEFQKAYYQQKHGKKMT